MYDQQPLSYWFQVGGEAIVGSLTGARLKVMPSVTTTWAGWLALHPDTWVLSRDTGYRRDYSRDPFIGIETVLNAGSFPFPVTDAVEDDRLAPAELVLGIEVGDQARAYPIARLGDAAINDRLGGERIVIQARALGPVVAAYSAEAGGRSLTFEARDGVYRDAETGSEWSVAGEAVSGRCLYGPPSGSATSRPFRRLASTALLGKPVGPRRQLGGGSRRPLALVSVSEFLKVHGQLFNVRTQSRHLLSQVEHFGQDISQEGVGLSQPPLATVRRRLQRPRRLVSA